MASSKVLDPNCSIARSLGVLGERWTFLILREAIDGVTRFAQFRDALGIAPDVLTDRLTTLVDYGVMSRVPYQEPGSRTRYAYTLTPAGEELHVALGSLQQWGDAYLPRPDGPTIERRARKTNRPVHVGFIDDRGREVTANEVAAIRTSAYPAPDSKVRRQRRDRHRLITTTTTPPRRA
jgi:DNA-binding HxlR family transcriptional regulator